MSDAPVLVEREGGIGRLRLNRPEALHALTREMCVTMADALLDWRDDAALKAVTIDHRAGRGFCAGGDIRALWESARGDGVAARRFFHAEYRLNHLLFTYGKPVIAFLDGITMGGGIGISQPARFRIATERTMYAMPESGIGLFPDVGGGWYLSRLPGRIGPYLAATGARIDGGDCMALGLATHFIPSERLPALKTRLASEPGAAQALLDEAAEAPPASALREHRSSIDRLFASDRYEDILRALTDDLSDFAGKTLDSLAAKSPQSVKVGLRELALSLGLPDFAAEMRMEYRIATRICRQHDFIEGVRALIVDKSNDPRWEPPTPEEVDDAAVEAIFAPLDDEWTPFPDLQRSLA